MNLHFDKDIKLKTVIGGACTLFIKVYVAYIALVKGTKMLNDNLPYVSSLEENIEPEFQSK